MNKSTQARRAETLDTLTAIVNQQRTTCVSALGKSRVGYLARVGEEYRLIGRASGRIYLNFSLASVQSARLVGEDFARVQVAKWA